MYSIVLIAQTPVRVDVAAFIPLDSDIERAAD